MAPLSFWPSHDKFLTFAQAFALLSLCIIPIVLYRLFLGPLQEIPGPLSARLSRLWMVKHSWQGDMHRTMIELHKKHGKLVRTGPNEVSVADLSAIKKIYGAGTKFVKSPWYSVFQGYRKFDLFAERDETIHSAQRRLVSRIYSMDALLDFEKYINDAIAHFIMMMRTRQDQDINMGLFVQLFAFGELPNDFTASLLKLTQARCDWRGTERGSWQCLQIPY